MISKYLFRIVLKALNAKDKLDAEQKSAGPTEEEVKKLKEDIAQKEMEYRIKEQEIEALVKIKQQKDEIELEKKKVAVCAEYQKKEMELINKHHENALKLLDEAKKELGAIYKDIIARLPNVNMNIEKKV